MGERRFGRRAVLTTFGVAAAGSMSGCSDVTVGTDPGDERDGTEGGSPEKRGAAAGIVDVAVDRGLYSRDGTVEATVTVHNGERTERRYWIGFSVIDVTGTAWDHGARTHRPIVVPANDTASRSVEWPIERAAPTGAYSVVVALWERETDNGLAGELTRRRYPAAFVITAVTPNGVPIRGDSVYVWGGVREILGDAEATERFVGALERLGVTRAFVAWGALARSARRGGDAVASLRERCSVAGIELSILWGERLGMDGVDRLRSDLPSMTASAIESIHIDLEPDPDGDAALSAFLGAYEDVLDGIEAGPEISTFVAPFWFGAEPDAARRVRDHDRVEWTVIAAYRNTEAGCRRELEVGLSGEPSVPYYAAFEFQSPAVDVVDDGITFWGVGAERSMKVIGSIARNPPVPELFCGVGLHDYGAVTDDHYRN